MKINLHGDIKKAIEKMGYKVPESIDFNNIKNVSISDNIEELKEENETQITKIEYNEETNEININYKGGKDE